MLYDVRLHLHYAYAAPVQSGRHLIRVRPVSIARVQRVVATVLTCDPPPDRETTFQDFFGNSVTTISYDGPHEHLDIRLGARVMVEDLQPPADLSPTLVGLKGDIARLWSVAPDSPHHFLGPSQRIRVNPEITTYVRGVIANTSSVVSAATALCRAIHADFAYDAKATDVHTSPSEAFAIRKGVCQDFAHIMIAGLRGVGIPAGYVSGFLRTNPPPGKQRLEGSDAMHAWVKVWCGQHVGWLEFDPTNAMIAGPDHISIGSGRDYADISPIVGVFKTSGKHKTRQSVDVVQVE